MGYDANTRDYGFDGEAGCLVAANKNMDMRCRLEFDDPTEKYGQKIIRMPEFGLQKIKK